MSSKITMVTFCIICSILPATLLYTPANGRCGDDKVKCKTSDKCIFAVYWCDGVSDCDDKSDEGNHCLGYTCQTNYTKCDNNIECYKESYKCDKFQDCHDKSDEKDCPTSSLSPPDARHFYTPLAKKVSGELRNKLSERKYRPNFRKVHDSDKYSNDKLLDQLARLLDRQI